MNYGEFKQQVADYVHRTDLADKIPDFIESGRAMMDRDMRVRELISSLTYTPSSNPFPVPDGFLESRELYTIRNGNRVSLTLVGRRQLAFYSSTNISQSRPLFYSVDGLEIETKPGGDGVEFTQLYYKSITPLVNDSDTSIILDVYPKVWLYAAVFEAGLYTQDFEISERFESRYVNEVTSANQRAKESESGASLQMQGASQWG